MSRMMRTMALAVTAVALAAAARADIVIVSIDNGASHQTFEGFGASHVSLMYEQAGQMVDYLGPVLRARALDAIYNQVRITTGNLESVILESPAGYSERTNDDNDPFNYNWPGFSFRAADAMLANVLDLAPPGFDNFYLGSKINVRWASPWLANIRANDYSRYLDECAEQVLATHIHWRDAYGIVPKFAQLFNEPLSGNRELWPGSTQEVVDIVKRAGARLRAEGFPDLMFVVPAEETEQRSLNLATAILADPLARAYVGAIAFHPYPYGSQYSGIRNILNNSGTGNPDPPSVAVRNQLRDLGQQYGIPVWMTEVSNGGVDPRSFDDLRGRAIHIHDEMIHADAAAFFGMLNMWDMRSQTAHFGNNNLYGSGSEGTIVLINQDTQDVTITGMGYAIGHYARWINRGAVRIDAVSSDPLLQVTAFRDDGQGRMVLVAINNDTVEKTLEVSLSGSALRGDLTGEQSTQTTRWQPLDPFSPSAPAGFTLTVPPRSVTTIAGELARGDLNCDGRVDALDIEPFLVALFDPEEYPNRYPDCDINLGDLNGDGSIDALDIEPFLNLLFP